MGLFLSLLILGVILLVVELFVPGGIFGFVGVFCLLASVVVSYVEFGAVIGNGVLVGVVLASAIGFWWFVTIFPRTRLAQKTIMLNTSIAKADYGMENLVGKTGAAITPLRPSGKAEISGERIDVVSEGGFLKRGTAIRVVEVVGTRVVVRGI